MKKKILVLLGILCVISINAYSYINIYPTEFNKEIEQSGTKETYRLYNGTDTAKRYTVAIESYEKEEDMSKWIKYYPKSLTLKPNESGEINLLVSAPKDVSNGEYSAFILVSESTVPELDKDGKLMREDSLKVLTKLKMGIHGWVGKLPIRLNSEGKKIKNESERRVTLEVFLKEKSEKKEVKFLKKVKLLSKEELDLNDILKNEKSVEIEKILIYSEDNIVLEVKN